MGFIGFGLYLCVILKVSYSLYIAYICIHLPQNMCTISMNHYGLKPSFSRYRSFEMHGSMIFVSVFFFNSESGGGLVKGFMVCWSAAGLLTSTTCST